MKSFDVKKDVVLPVITFTIQAVKLLRVEEAFSRSLKCYEYAVKVGEQIPNRQHKAFILYLLLTVRQERSECQL